jgi:DNA-binding CsgD family transcriptional regulator
MTRPFVMVRDGPGAAETLALAAARLRADGWLVVDDFDSRPQALRSVLHGTVVTPRDAAAALLAALDGFGLLVRAAGAPEVVDRLVDDLERLGPVELLSAHGRAGSADGPDRPDARPGVPGADGRAILALLADGHSLGEAAARLGLSRRTADRRLAEIRTTLGVTRTTEAIARAVRAGWLIDATSGSSGSYGPPANEPPDRAG